jgi:hypothetical protein
MIYSVLYILFFSFGLVLIQKVDVNISPFFSLLFASVLATIYFNVVNFRKLKAIYLHVFQNKKIWLIVMLIVLWMWLTTIFGPGLIGASFFNFIYFALLGILGFLFTSLKDFNKNKNKFYLGVTISLLLAFSIIFFLTKNFDLNKVIGILLALLGGVGSFVYFKQSQIFMRKTNFSASQVLAVRFYLAIFLLSFLSPFRQTITTLHFNQWLDLLMLTLATFIIPLYFSQKALEKISAETHAIINSFCPLITGVFQWVFFRDLAVFNIIIYFLYAFLISGFYFTNHLTRVKKDEI